MKKSDAIRLRKQVRSLARKGLSISAIARHLGVSRLFVRTWKDAENPVEDERGWTKGNKRKYTAAQEQRVLAARDEAEQEFFSVRMPSRRNCMKMFP